MEHDIAIKIPLNKNRAAVRFLSKCEMWLPTFSLTLFYFPVAATKKCLVNVHLSVRMTSLLTLSLL